MLLVLLFFGAQLEVEDIEIITISRGLRYGIVGAMLVVYISHFFIIGFYQQEINYKLRINSDQGASPPYEFQSQIERKYYNFYQFLWNQSQATNNNQSLVLFIYMLFFGKINSDSTIFFKNQQELHMLWLSYFCLNFPISSFSEQLQTIEIESFSFNYSTKLGSFKQLLLQKSSSSLGFFYIIWKSVTWLKNWLFSGKQIKQQKQDEGSIKINNKSSNSGKTLETFEDLSRIEEVDCEDETDQKIFYQMLTVYKDSQ